MEEKKNGDVSPAAGSPALRALKKIPAYRIALGLVVFFAWFGLIGPSMISAESNTLVLGWILFTIAGVGYAFKLITRKIK